MKNRALNYVLLGQACLYGGLLASVILKPGGLAANDGISFYGNYELTIIPYIVSLLGSAYFTIKTADQLDEPIARNILSLIGLLTTGILITPVNVAHMIARVHIYIGTVLFSLQLILSHWLAYKLKFKAVPIALLLVEWASGVAAWLYLWPPQGLLLQAQVIYQLAFGGLLCYGLSKGAFEAKGPAG